MENSKINTVIKALEKVLCMTIVKRVLCIILLAFAIEKDIIAKKLKLSMVSINKYEKMLNEERIDEIMSIKGSSRKSELEDYKNVIFAELESGEYKNLRQIAAMIERLTGLKRSRQRINVFLKKTDIARLK